MYLVPVFEGASQARMQPHAYHSPKRYLEPSNWRQKLSQSNKYKGKEVPRERRHTLRARRIAFESAQLCTTYLPPRTFHHPSNGTRIHFGGFNTFWESQHVNKRIAG